MSVILNKERISTIVANRDERVAYVRTSDMIQFLGCRRRWDLSSHLRQNLGPKVYGDPLWLGSGMHYALEDFHGDNVYGTPGKSFQAYCVAHVAKHKHKLPQDYKELVELGTSMMDYYPIWLKGRDPIDTYVHKGVLQVEPAIQIDIPMEELPAYERIRERYDRVVYALQLDRVGSIDNELWVVEYKSAKTMVTSHYAFDPQISAYKWAAKQVYDKPIAGIIYHQFRKDLPKAGRILKNGEVSIAQNQRTSHRLYRETLLDVYDSIEKAPHDNIEYLNNLALMESADADEFIRRDKVYRNEASSNATVQRLLQVANDMLDPALPIYSNPVRMCANYCPFMSVCVSMDDGSDYQTELELEFENRDLDYDSWRPFLPDPKDFEGIKLK